MKRIFTLFISLTFFLSVYSQQKTDGNLIIENNGIPTIKTVNFPAQKAISATMFGQAPDWKWAKSAGGSQDDWAKSITTDAAGNKYVIGDFSSSTITFGETTLANAGNSDMFIVKYASNGNVLWAKGAGGIDEDGCNGVSIDNSGNVYITGCFHSPTITFGNITLVNTDVSNMFVVKYDSEGNVLWAKSARCAYGCAGFGITIDVSGNVCIAGCFYNSAITFGNITLANLGDWDIFVAKYDSEGNILWAKSAGGAMMDRAPSITTDTSGNIYITGYFNSPTITFGNTTLINAGIYDVHIAKYDSEGNVLWAKSAGGDNWDEGYSITADVSGNIYITGYFSSPTITFGNTVLTRVDGSDIFIVKYDSEGNVLWAKSAGGIEHDWSNWITTDVSGNVYITGGFASPTITFGSTILTNADNWGSDDIFIAKYGSEGNVLWAKRAGGMDNEQGTSIVTDASGNINITGYFYSPTITFDTTTLVNAGGRDVFIATSTMFGQNINEEWWAKSAGGSQDDWAKSITTDAAGNKYVIGDFSSSTITFGETTLANAGNSDMFIVKYASNGNVLWAKGAGGIDEDGCNGVSIDNSGNVYITGCFHSPTITFGNITLVNTDVSNMFVVKYDSEGNVLWAKSARCAYGCAGFGITIDVSGNVCIAGCFYNSAITFGNITLANLGDWDIFVAKYDSEGNILWAKSAGGAMMDRAPSITTDTSGNIYITGYFNSPTITFGNTTLINAGIYDVHIAKYDSEGNVLWAKSAGGDNWDEGYSITADVSGNIYITGYFSSPTITFGNTVLTRVDGSDIFIVKYDSEGNVLWAKSAGGIEHDWSNWITTDVSGNVYITGGFASPTITFGSTILTNADNWGSDDIFIAKYGSEGNVLWAKRAGGMDNEQGTSIVTDASGNINITGYFYSPTITFDTTTLVNAGGRDVFIANLKITTLIASNNGPVCEGSILSLSASTIPGATYEWTGPNGYTSNLQNPVVSNNATMTMAGTYFVSVIVNGVTNYTDSTIVIVNTIPSAPIGDITGPATFCQGQTGVEYSVEPIAYATGYVWTIPSDATIVSGANTNTITVNFSNTAVPGSFTVYGTNDCGDGIVSLPYNVTIGTCVTVSGMASYPNIANTPLDDLTINLKNGYGSVVGTTTTTTNGFYSFPGVPSGNYSLNVSTTKTWDGVTASDILLFHRHIVNTYTLSGIFLASGDVDLSNDLTASDVLLMKKRIAHVSNSFPSGDWLFNNQLLTVDSSNITQNFNGIVYGDANGSYIPTETDFDVRYQGNISIGSANESIGELTLPVIISNMPNLGSFQFTIQYDASKLQWLGVTDWYPGIDMAMVANPAPGLLTFVWAADANGINISQGTLCNLRFDSKLAGSSAISFENNPTKKEFSDYEGNLFAPQYTNGNIGSATNITDPASSEVAVYPNPSNGQFTLDLTAIQPGTFAISLYNSLGVMAYQKSVVGVNGKTRLNLNMTTLPDGVYLLRVQGNNVNYITKILITK